MFQKSIKESFHINSPQEYNPPPCVLFSLAEENIDRTVVFCQNYLPAEKHKHFYSRQRDCTMPSQAVSKLHLRPYPIRCFHSKQNIQLNNIVYIIENGDISRNDSFQNFIKTWKILKGLTELEI